MTAARSHDPRALTPRVDAALGLLLAGVAAALVIAWPDRATEANGSWYVVAITRQVGLALLAAAAAMRVPVRRPGDRPRDLVDVGLAWLVTLPFETVAWHGTAPSDALSWSIVASLLAAFAVYGVAATTAVVAMRAHVFWAMPLLVPAVAFALGMLDVRTGPVLLLPWLLPFEPSWIGAVALGSVAVATVGIVAFRAGRGTGSS